MYNYNTYYKLLHNSIKAINKNISAAILVFSLRPKCE